MSIEHEVEQGEHLPKIAEMYGYHDYKVIWDHADNKKLKDLRKNPNVLLPGDIVKIPDRKPEIVKCQTDKKYRFQLAGEVLHLRLALLDYNNEPLPDTECELRIDGNSIPLKSDGDGRIEAPISADVKEATLVFKDPQAPFEREIKIQIGALDPVEEVSGQKARLSNLGYITSPLDEVDDTLFAHAVEEFQCDHGIKVTGECDSGTQGKLKEIHGS
jgi:hypothetical protein